MIAPLAARRLARAARPPFSPSALESWTACPVAWFVERGLRAEKLAPDEIWPRAARPPTRRCGGLRGPSRANRQRARSRRRACPLALEALDAALAAPRRPLSPSEAVERAERWRLRSDLRRYLEHAAGSASTHEPRASSSRSGSRTPSSPRCSGRRAPRAGRADRSPRRRPANRRRRSSTTTRPARASRRSRAGSRTAASSPRSTCSPPSGSSAWRRRAASTSRCERSDLRARGAVRDDVDTAAALFANDRLRRRACAR